MLEDVKIAFQCAITPQILSIALAFRFAEIFYDNRLEQKISLQEKLHAMKTEWHDLTVHVFVADDASAVTIFFKMSRRVVNDFAKKF